MFKKNFIKGGREIFKSILLASNRHWLLQAAHWKGLFYFKQWYHFSAECQVKTAQPRLWKVSGYSWISAVNFTSLRHMYIQVFSSKDHVRLYLRTLEFPKGWTSLTQHGFSLGAEGLAQTSAWGVMLTLWAKEICCLSLYINDEQKPVTNKQKMPYSIIFWCIFCTISGQVSPIPSITSYLASVWCWPHSLML